MTRRAALILLSTCLLAASAVACNLPGISKQPEVTQTFEALITQTAAYESTLGAQQTSLSLTQTAAIPTATSTASQTPTTAPTDTPAATSTAQSAATGAATGNATAKVASGGATQTSIANGALSVGIEAIVRITGGVPLNIRDNPGKKAKVIARVPADTRVKIIDGPKAMDGVLWWQVKVLTSSVIDALDKTGWCAEFDGAQTLEAAK